MCGCVGGGGRGGGRLRGKVGDSQYPAGLVIRLRVVGRVSNKY